MRGAKGDKNGDMVLPHAYSIHQSPHLSSSPPAHVPHLADDEQRQVDAVLEQLPDDALDVLTALPPARPAMRSSCRQVVMTLRTWEGAGGGK